MKIKNLISRITNIWQTAKNREAIFRKMIYLAQLKSLQHSKSSPLYFPELLSIAFCRILYAEFHWSQADS